jgi:MFS family permease
MLRPPVSLSTVQWRLVAALLVLSANTGYQGSVTTQSITFIAEEFRSSDRQQANALSIIRFDIILSIIVMRFADRFGRRRTLLVSAIAGPILTGVCAVAPSLGAFTAMQVVGRGFVTASAILLGIILVEELPNEARAWGAAMAVAAAAGGSFLVLAVLPIAGHSITSWRVLYLFPIAGLLPIIGVRGSVLESRRFTDLAARRAAGYIDSTWKRHIHRLIVIALWIGLIGIFITPARQFANDYLRKERGLSAGQLSIFNIITNIPATAGLFIGGSVSDRFGRRRTAAAGLLVYAVSTAIIFRTSGATMWAFSLLSSLAGAFALPSLSIMVAELFPTELRSRVNGMSTGINRVGGVIGLQIVGHLAKNQGIGRTLSVMSVSVIIGTLIMLKFLPETAHRSLEDINHESAPLPPPAMFL